LDDLGSFFPRKKDFSLHQSSSWASASYSPCTRTLHRKSKRPEREAVHSSPSGGNVWKHGALLLRRTVLHDVVIMRIDNFAFASRLEVTVVLAYPKETNH
jgi:hypothetical protein